MRISPEMKTWLKCFGTFVALGIASWWIWDNPIFTIAPEEPGPFFDYNPEILGIFVWVYFAPAILAALIDSKANPVQWILSIRAVSEQVALVGFLVATIVLPLFYGTILYTALRIARFVRGAVKLKR